MTEPELKQMKQDIHDILVCLKGDTSTTDGGLAGNVIRMMETLYGTQSEPGGIVRDVWHLKRGVLVGVGFLAAMDIFIRFWPTIKHAI